MLKIFKKLNKSALLIAPLAIGGMTACIDSTEQVPSGALFFINSASNLPKGQLRLNDQTGALPEFLEFGEACCFDFQQSPSLLVRALDTTYTIAIYNDPDTNSLAVTEQKIEAGESYFYLLSRDVSGTGLVMQRYKQDAQPVTSYTTIRFVNSSYFSSTMGGVDIYVTDTTVMDLSNPATLPIDNVGYLESSQYLQLPLPEKAFHLFIAPAGVRAGTIATDENPNVGNIRRYKYRTEVGQVMAAGTIRTVFILNSGTASAEALPFKTFLVGF